MSEDLLTRIREMIEKDSVTDLPPIAKEISNAIKTELGQKVGRGELQQTEPVFEKIGPAILEKLNGQRLVGKLSYDPRGGFFFLFEPMRDSMGAVISYVTHRFPRTAVAQITQIEEDAMIQAQRDLVIGTKPSQYADVPVQNGSNYPAIVAAPPPPPPQRILTEQESRGRPITFDHMGIPIYVNDNIETSDFEGGFGRGE